MYKRNIRVLDFKAFLKDAKIEITNTPSREKRRREGNSHLRQSIKNEFSGVNTKISKSCL